MATRIIVTSQPDVACDVCERRLLRGEHSDVYLAAGRRRIVCELCAPRAAHEGWRRESEGQELGRPSMRTRRGRSLLGRLRQVGRPGDGAPSAAEGEPAAESASEPELAYDFLDSYAGAEPAAAQPHRQVTAEPVAAEQPEVDESVWLLERAVQLFNASEFPRRIAGVSRSLGVPEVSVRAAEHHSSVILIVVAWELSWYRYQVDLSVEGAAAEAVGQGTELGELGREERLSNASADESGSLQFLGA